MSIRARSGNSPVKVPLATVSSHAQAAVPSGNGNGFSPQTLIITATTLRISLSSSTSNQATISSAPTRPMNYKLAFTRQQSPHTTRGFTLTQPSFDVFDTQQQSFLVST